MHFPTYEAAEAAARELGLSPFRLPYHTDRYAPSIGQVQSLETCGAATYGHPKFCAEIEPAS